MATFACTINVIAGLYLLSRRLVKEEPFKSRLDRHYLNLNNFLVLIKGSVIKELLMDLARRFRTLMYVSFIVLVIAALSGLNTLVPAGVIVFACSMLFHISVEWIYNHKKLMTKTLMSVPYLLMIFWPLVLLLAQKLLNLPFYDQVIRSAPTNLNLLSDEWQNAFLLTAIDVIALVMLPYVILWLIALPIFYMQFITLYSLTGFLKLSYRLNKNLLDVIMLILAFIANISFIAL